MAQGNRSLDGKCVPRVGICWSDGGKSRGPAALKVALRVGVLPQPSIRRVLVKRGPTIGRASALNKMIGDQLLDALANEVTGDLPGAEEPFTD